MRTRDWRPRPNTILGVVLVGLGVLFLLSRFLDLNLTLFLWPFFIIIPGVLFFVGMALGGRPAGPLAIPGSIVTMTGLILLYQSIMARIDSSAFATWAYAWALVFPTSVGMGLMINGAWSNEPRLVHTGVRWTLAGLAIYVLLGGFFELLINLTDNPISDLMWPALLIGGGVYLLRRRPVRRAAAGASVPAAERPPAPPAPPAPPQAPAPPRPARASKPKTPVTGFEPIDPARGARGSRSKSGEE